VGLTDDRRGEWLVAGEEWDVRPSPSAVSSSGRSNRSVEALVAFTNHQSLTTKHRSSRTLDIGHRTAKP